MKLLPVLATMLLLGCGSTAQIDGAPPPIAGSCDAVPPCPERAHATCSNPDAGTVACCFTPDGGEPYPVEVCAEP